jgi:hypothetical protein
MQKKKKKKEAKANKETSKLRRNDRIFRLGYVDTFVGLDSCRRFESPVPVGADMGLGNSGLTLVVSF